MQTMIPMLVLCAATLASCTSSEARCDSALPVAGEGWVRATAQGQPTGAAYFTLRSQGACEFTLIDVSSPVARGASIHQSSVEDGMSRMVARAEAVVPADGALRFEPGGLHVMLEGLEAPLEAGSTVPLRLAFDNGQTLTFRLAVVEAGSR